jgi:hypothetical protein
VNATSEPRVPNDHRHAVLRRAAERAVRAPSIHNTQPWTFMISEDALEIHADFDRQLTVLDPRRRQFMISCGCALFHVRVAIEAAGYEPLVRRLADPRRPTLLARVQVGRAGSWPGSRALDRAIDRRRTNRRTLAGGEVPPQLVRTLASAVSAEDATLVHIGRPEDREAVARLAVNANAVEEADPAYLAELAAWTTDDLRRTDGVQAASVPYATSDRVPRAPSALRRFDLRSMGWLPPDRGQLDGCLVVLCTDADEPYSWLRAGEALERMWLTLTDKGFWASPVTQVVEVPTANRGLRETLGLTTHPQVVLRVGRAAETVPTRRRRAVDVIVEK